MGCSSGRPEEFQSRLTPLYTRKFFVGQRTPLFLADFWFSECNLAWRNHHEHSFLSGGKDEVECGLLQLVPTVRSFWIDVTAPKLFSLDSAPLMQPDYYVTTRSLTCSLVVMRNQSSRAAPMGCQTVAVWI